MSQSPSFTPAGAVVDLDGTLLDTEPLYFNAYAAVAKHFGHEYTFEKVHRYLLGRAEAEGAANMIKILGIPDVTPHELLEMRDTFLIEEFKHAVCLPGALEAMRALKRGGLALSIATSSSRKYLPVKRSNNEELFDLFESVVCGDDAEVGGKSKPDPAIFLAGAKSINVPPTACIAFEDSIAGVRSAKAAGMFVIAIPDARLEPAELAAAAPDVVIRSFLEFDPALHAGIRASP